jgi:hypothetical protein
MRSIALITAILAIAMICVTLLDLGSKYPFVRLLLFSAYFVLMMLFACLSVRESRSRSAARHP